MGRRSDDDLGSTIGKIAGKGCADGCTRGCTMALPLVLVSLLYSLSNLFMSRTSIHDFFVGLIRDYQIQISPKINIDCFFTPSCSNYSVEVIDKHGVLKGLFKIMVRIMKCNPFLVRQRTEKILDLP